MIYKYVDIMGFLKILCIDNSSRNNYNYGMTCPFGYAHTIFKNTMLTKKENLDFKFCSSKKQIKNKKGIKMNIEEEIKKYEEEIKALNLTKGLNLNSKQTAQVIGVAQSTVEKWRVEGIGIQYISVGKRVMYPIRAIAKWQVLNQIKTA